MSQQYGVIDVKAGTGFTRAQSNEHLRNYAKGAEEANMAGNLDSSRIHLNFEIGKGGVIKEVDKSKSIPQRIKEIEQQWGIDNPNKDKKEDDPDRRKTVANIILMGSHDQMQKLAFGDQYVGEKYLDDDGKLVKPDNSYLERKREIELWAQDMYRFIANKFRERNIAAFIVHLDETTPHVHCTLLPIAHVKGKERYSWNKTFMGNKYKAAEFFRKLHTELAEVNQRWGLQRGQDVRLTNNKHRSTEEYRAWLRVINSQLEQEVMTKQEALSEMSGKEKQLETKIKGLSTMLTNLENQKAELEFEIGELEEVAKDSKENNDELTRQLFSKREELKTIDEKIDMRREQVNDAVHQLENLAYEEKELRKECDNLDSQYREKTSQIYDEALLKMNSIAWQQAHMEAEYKAEKIEDFRESLPEEYREKFDEIYDGSIFEDMTERAEEVVAVATSIFLGLPKQAIAYSQAHGGGGGGGAGGGWGRKKDEDDEAYAHRCFIMGRLLMHPVGPKRKLKR